MGLLWDALTYSHRGAGSELYHWCDYNKLPALGARPEEGPEGNKSPSAAALCPTKLADSRVLIFPNLYYKMGFAV